MNNSKKTTRNKKYLGEKNINKNNSWKNDSDWKGQVYKLPDYLFFIGLIFLISYFIVYFNAFTNYSDYTVFGPKNTQIAISTTGFVLCFISILFLILRNLIITNRLKFFTFYSLLVLLMLVEIYILFVIDLELRKEPKYVNIFSSQIDIEFFNNWINSIRGSLIISLIFLYVLISSAELSSVYIVLSSIFIVLCLLPIIVLLSKPSEISTITDNYKKYGIYTNFSWYTNRDLSYYTGFASIFIGILYIYTIYKNYNYKKFIK